LVAAVVTVPLAVGGALLAPEVRQAVFGGQNPVDTASETNFDEELFVLLATAGNFELALKRELLAVEGSARSPADLPDTSLSEAEAATDKAAAMFKDAAGKNVVKLLNLSQTDDTDRQIDLLLDDPAARLAEIRQEATTGHIAGTPTPPTYGQSIEALDHLNHELADHFSAEPLRSLAEDFAKDIEQGCPGDSNSCQDLLATLGEAIQAQTGEEPNPTNSTYIQDDEPAVDEAAAPFRLNTDVAENYGRRLSELRDEYGEELVPVQEFHGEYFVEPTGVPVSYYFTSAAEDWSASDSDVCRKIAGELGALVDGLDTAVTLEEFAEALYSPSRPPTYEVVTGQPTSYYVTDGQIGVVDFAVDDDPSSTGRFQIALEPDDTVSPDSYTWFRIVSSREL
jgi:hypothetical protein